jgi:hypothetical protein
MSRDRLLVLVFAICCLQIGEAKANTVTVSDIGFDSISMDYNFTIGAPYDTFTVNSVTVDVSPSSAYSAFLPPVSTFTGFAPLTAPTCLHNTCLDDFGVLNKGEAAGYNPYPIWAWFGSEESYGYDSSSGATLGTFVIDFYVSGSPTGSHNAYLADSAGMMDVLLSDGQKTGLDFNFGVAAVPVPAALPLFASALAATGVCTRLWKCKPGRTRSGKPTNPCPTLAG